MTTFTAPQLLVQALEALNTAPRFAVGNSDSYKIAAAIETHLADAVAEAGTASPTVKRYVVQAYMLTGDEIGIDAADADAARRAADKHFKAKYPDSTCEITQVDEVTA
jgi:hypothetical protein